MDFFLPMEPDKNRALEVLKVMKQHFRLDEDAIAYFRVDYTMEGRSWTAEVGKAHELNGEIVQLILKNRTHGAFYICTHNRGIFKGAPIYAAEDPFTTKTWPFPDP